MPSTECVAGGAAGAEALLATLAASSGARWRLQDRFEVQAGTAYATRDCVAVDGVDTQSHGEPVTVTLYTQRAAFHAAQQQYKSFMFRIMLRPVLAQVSGGGDGAECSPAGCPLPPFLVTPRCVSIAQWARSAQGVTATTLVMAQQLEGYVRAVCKLHEKGYAHCELAPHSVVCCGAQHGWCFWDLDAAVRIGTERRIGGGLKYMPPEVVHAVECSTAVWPAAAAADVWAIGVLAYELLTRQPAFPHAFPCAFDAAVPEPAAGAHTESCGDGLQEHARRAVRDQLLGRTPLPWEAEAPGAEARLACMGRFRDSVLRCLSRGPQQRPSAEGLLKLWREVYLLRYEVR